MRPPVLSLLQNTRQEGLFKGGPEGIFPAGGNGRTVHTMPTLSLKEFEGIVLDF
jgi:hypothetical protein